MHRNLTFSWQIRALSWISEKLDYLEQGCPTRDPPDRVSRLAATFVNDTQVFQEEYAVFQADVPWVDKQKYLYPKLNVYGDSAELNFKEC